MRNIFIVILFSIPLFGATTVTMQKGIPAAGNDTQVQFNSSGVLAGANITISTLTNLNTGTLNATNSITLAATNLQTTLSSLQTQINGPLAVAQGGTASSTAAAAEDKLNQSAEVSLASASTVNIGAAAGQQILITGTTTITAFDSIAAGTKRYIRFNGVLTLTHNATTLILPNNGSNITTANGDTMLAISEGSGNWRIRTYQKINGQALVDNTGGAGGTVGTVINSGTPLANALPMYNDTTGTNIAPTKVTVSSLTNLLTGTLTATNSITVGTGSTTPGSEILGDAGTHQWAINATNSMTTNVWNIMELAPYPGLRYATLTSATNLYYNNTNTLGGLNGILGSTLFNDTRTITINGTANEITSSAGAQDLSANRTWTLSLPSTIDLGGKTSFEIPNSAAPVTDAAGEIALDTTITSHDPLVQYYGNVEMLIPAIRRTDLTTTDGAVIVYDSANSKFKMAPVVGSTSEQVSAYGSGTAYSITATPALVDMGTTDPSITLTNAGRYVLLANLGAKYNAATYAANQTLTVKLRKTSGTAADVANATRTITLRIITGITDSIETIQVPPVFYDAAANDIIQVWASLSATPSAGSVDVSSVEVTAFTVLAGSGSATAWDNIADPSTSSSIAFAGFTNQFTTTLDGGTFLSIRNTDVDNASDTTLLRLGFDDGADVNSIFVDFISDEDGTPVSVFKVTATAITSTLPLSIGTSAAATVGSIELGHATDTTLTRASAGDVAIEGNNIYRVGGADVALADGGSGQSTANGAEDAFQQVAEVSLASATTTDLGAQTSQKVLVTGTTTITSFGTVAAGTTRDVRFNGALILTHNATSLILPTGANITTANGDILRAISEGSGNWRIRYYTRADGTPLQGYATVQEEGSGLTKRNTLNFIGGGVTAADNSTKTDVTITRTGVERSLWIPASAMVPSNTNFPSSATISLGTTTNYVTKDVFDFDDTVDEKVEFQAVFPHAWNASTIKYKVYFYSAAATTGAAEWELRAKSVADNESDDVAWGTGILVTKTVSGTATRLNVTSTSAALTIATTPAINEVVDFELYRRPTDTANDTLVGDARMSGLMLYYTETTTEPAAP